MKLSSMSLMKMLMIVVKFLKVNVKDVLILSLLLLLFFASHAAKVASQIAEVDAVADSDVEEDVGA